MVIDLETECWEWDLKVEKTGYASIRSKPKILGHRASWEVFNGEIPDGLCVLHKCDNRRCINPDHLFLGTKRDNILDCVKKGRHPCSKVVSVEGEKFSSRYEASRELGIPPATIFYRISQGWDGYAYL